MSTVAFYLLVVLVVAKVLSDVSTPRPYEFVGELLAIVVALTVAGVGAAALWLIGW